MLWVDRGSAILLIVLGCVHNFIVAPSLDDTPTTRVLWFVTGGITLWYAGLMNLMVSVGDALRRDRFAQGSVFLANLVLFVFAIAFMYVRNSWFDPQNLALVVPAAWLLIRTGWRA